MDRNTLIEQVKAYVAYTPLHSPQYVAPRWHWRTLFGQIKIKGDTMPRGKCVRCGGRYTGWALLQSQHRICVCGGEIKVEKEINGTDP